MTRPIHILMVEDSPGDVRLTQEALKTSKIANEISVAQDGVEALQMLRQAMQGGQPPDLILLDLNLPRRDGREVLEEIKSDPALHQIPVVVMTSSEAEEDVVKSYQLHANAYIKKPIDLHQFAAVVRAVEDFWLAIVKLPTRAA